MRGWTKSGLGALILAGLWVSSAPAQQPTLTTVRISSVPPGREVYVDNQIYVAPVTFVWPTGSKHVLRGEDQVDVVSGTRYGFGGFFSEAGPLTPGPDGSIVVTADPRIAEFVANFAVTYRLRVAYFDCGPGFRDPDNPCPSPPSPGRVLVGGSLFTMSGETFVPAGVVTLQAIPAAGWVFAGWYSTPTFQGTAYLNSMPVTGQSAVYPQFIPARTINVESKPSGLQVFLDRQGVFTPHRIEWGRGTVHNLGGPHDQIDRFAKLWIFDGWEHGGEPFQDYLVPDGEAPLTLTARFVPGERVSFLTDPPGLRLEVDGHSNYPGYNFNWAVNATHTVSAPAEQVDALGQTWVFRAWSNGGPATQTITVPDNLEGKGLRLTAHFEPRASLRLTSGRPVTFVVDGESCAAPCTISRDVGASVTVAAPAELPAAGGSRIRFLSWSDGGPAERTLTLGAEPVTLNASYQLQHLLAGTVEPAGGAVLRFTPASPDGYFRDGAEVLVRLEVRPGFEFLGWDGAASGLLREITLRMTGPLAIHARLEPVPALAPESVQSSAGPIPAAAVAPGSIVSIYGVSLAGDLKIGPANPLAQTLGDVTVRLGSRILPLLFVSPGQINAQMPSDLPDGDHRLLVRWEGKPEASTSARVKRNAPGVFYETVGDRKIGLFQRPDGSHVTLDAPAKADEAITVLTTGLGPYRATPPDGFVVPLSANFTLVDPVEIHIGDAAILPEYAGVAAGRVGINAVRFRVPAGLGAATAVPFRLIVNGQESNTVLLPLE